MVSLKKKRIKELIDQLSDVCSDFIVRDDTFSQDEKIDMLLQALVVQVGFSHRSSGVMSNSFTDSDGYKYELTITQEKEEEHAENGTIH